MFCFCGSRFCSCVTRVLVLTKKFCSLMMDSTIRDVCEKIQKSLWQNIIRYILPERWTLDIGLHYKYDVVVLEIERKPPFCFLFFVVLLFYFGKVALVTYLVSTFSYARTSLFSVYHK